MEFQELYRQIAIQHGTTPEQVRAEMQQALTAAWTKPGRTQEELARQAAISRAGPVPTPEEFLQSMAAMLTDIPCK